MSQRSTTFNTRQINHLLNLSKDYKCLSFIRLEFMLVVLNREVSVHLMKHKTASFNPVVQVALHGLGVCALPNT